MPSAGGKQKGKESDLPNDHVDKRCPTNMNCLPQTGMGMIYFLMQCWISLFQHFILSISQLMQNDNTEDKVVATSRRGTEGASKIQ